MPSIVINADKTVPIDDVVAVMRVAARTRKYKDNVLAVDKNGVSRVTRRLLSSDPFPAGPFVE